MTEIFNEIKIEPMDMEFPVIKEEELDIKTEIEDNSHTQVPQHELPDGFCTFIIKEELMHEDELNITEDTQQSLIPITESTQFECYACQSYFSSEDLLLNHNCIESLHETSNHWQCTDCLQKFVNQNDIATHKCKAKQCKNCEEYFETTVQLKNHEPSKCKFFKKCSVCAQVFVTPLVYQEHIQSHINRRKPLHGKFTPKQPQQNLFTCNICDLEFMVNTDLVKHYKTHGPEIICEDCGRHFKTKGGLQQHKKGKKCKNKNSSNVTSSRSTKNGVDVLDKVENVNENGVASKKKKIAETAVVAVPDINAVKDVDDLQLPPKAAESIVPAQQPQTALPDVDIPKPTANSSLQSVVGNPAPAYLVAAIPKLQPTVRVSQQNNFTFCAQGGNDLLLSTELDRPQSCFSAQKKEVIFDSQGNAFNITNNLPQYQPVHTPQRLDVIVDSLGNAYTLTNSLPQFRAQPRPQRLDVIVDGDGNAFVMKREDLITGDLQYPRVQTVCDQQVVVDAQGNSFTITQNPTEELGPREDIESVNKDHCYTRKKSILLHRAAEKKTSTDSMPYNDLLLEELFDRKTKSMAKGRKAASGSSSPIETDQKDILQTIKSEPETSTDNYTEMETTTNSCPNLSTEDFEKIFVSDVQQTIKSEPETIDGTATTNNLSTEDFEEMITSNKLPNSFRKSAIIESLKDQYQKAKLNSDMSSDESSQNSALPSIFCKVSEYKKVSTLEPNSNYRYAWMCDKCPRQYVQRHTFVKHQRGHGKKEEEISETVFELRPEIIPVPSGPSAYCTTCRLAFPTEQLYEQHLQEYHKEDTKPRPCRFQCPKCGRICSTRATLTDHVQQDCGRNPNYGCEVCGKNFYSRSTLQLHRTIHTGELPHKCEYCGKRVRTRGQLTVHRRTHTGERPFPCTVCERRFTHRETLISHLSRHIDMKRYKCAGCSMRFASISGLKMHRENRVNTCGKFKFSAQAVGPRVRVIRGNVMFEPQPKFNPYSRSNEDEEENTKENGSPENCDNVES